MKHADVPNEVYRLGRRPDPWALPDWSYAEADGTFGNRFDDSRGVYRVLYASTQRVATFIECLAYYRPDINVVAELSEIVGEPDDLEPPDAGLVPADWIKSRCVGRATLVGDYVDIGDHDSLAELRTALAGRVVHYGLSDLDAATIRLTAPRAFTQEISRYVFDLTTGGRRTWNGLAYGSKYGDDLQNWAVLEPVELTKPSAMDLTADDVDMAVALEVHGLRFESHA